MPRLDVCALKIVIDNAEDIFRRQLDNNLIQNERFQGTVNTFWNITRAIFLREEPLLGLEAIFFMQALVYLESKAIPNSVIVWVRRWISVLRKYDLISTTTFYHDSLVVHPLFYDVIRVKNESIEIDVLRNCVEILSVSNYEEKDITSAVLLWKEVLKYPELVRQYKRIGYNLCCYSYQRHFRYGVEKDLQTEGNTVEIFEGLFGTTDMETIRLKCYELRSLSLFLSPAPPILKTLLKKCTQINASVEECLTRSGIDDLSLLRDIFNCVSLAFELLARIEYLSKDFVIESLVLYKCIYDRYKNYFDFYARLHYQNLILKCLKLLPKVKIYEDNTEFLQKIRNVLLPADISFSDEDNLLFQYGICHSLTETVFHFLSTENIEESTGFKNALVEELVFLSKIWYDWAVYLSGVECKIPLDFIHKIPEIIRHLINCLIKLERFEKISSVIELTGKITERLLDGELDGYRLSVSSLSLLEMYRIVFKTVTSIQNLSHHLKNIFFKQSIISAKYILSWSGRTGRRLEHYCSQYDTQYRNSPQLHIIKCYVEMHSFSELALFYVEYEKCVMDCHMHSAKKFQAQAPVKREELVRHSFLSQTPMLGWFGNVSKTLRELFQFQPLSPEREYEKIIAEDMIDFSGLIIENLKPGEAVCCCQPLLQTMLTGTRKYLAMTSRSRSTTRRIKDIATKAIEFCQYHLGSKA